MFWAINLIIQNSRLNDFALKVYDHEKELNLSFDVLKLLFSI